MAISQTQRDEHSQVDLEKWSIVVDSIGTAGAGMVKALKTAVPIPETHLAQLLFQAPSVLLDGLANDVAHQVNELLVEAGLETRTVRSGESIDRGDSDHEMALVVRDISRMVEVLNEVAMLIGLSLEQAKSLLCKSPTILLGKVSANTVAACRARFEALGAELDVTRPHEAIYDVFLGQCSPAERSRVREVLDEFGYQPPDDVDEVVVQMGLNEEKAKQLWDRFSRSSAPLRLISRDFERFDLTLDAASDSPEMIEYLVSSTGMPKNVAQKIVSRTPVVLHQLIGFEAMSRYMEEIDKLGGSPTGHLIVFQSFDLRVSRVGNKSYSIQLLKMIADYDEASGVTALEEGVIHGPLTYVQARWLQWELQQVGTETERVLR